MMENLDEIIKYSKNLTLLYVEDNDDAREMTSMILEDFFGRVLTANDGEEGYEIYRREDVDIVMTDINMPRMNGLELSEKIRAENNDVPILILSAHNEENYFLESIRIGVNGYLLKPIDIDQLTDLLHRIIQEFRYRTEAEESLHLLSIYQQATNESSIVSKTDPRGIITFVNDAFCEISGYTREELIGKNHNIVRHPDNPKSVFADMWHTIKEKKRIWKGIVRNRAKNGKSYWVDSLVMPIADRNGNIVEYISLRHDITDIMNPSRQLAESVKNLDEPILIYMKLDEYDTLEEFYDNETVEAIQQKTAKYLQQKFSKKYTFGKIYQLGNGEFALVLERKRYLDDEEAFIWELKRLQQSIKDDRIGLDDLEYDIAVLMSVVYEEDKILESARLGIKELLKTKRVFLVANHLAIRRQEQARKNMEILAIIKHAIEDSRIVSYFQPIVDNATQKAVKYESLVRLIDENSKVLPPFFFLEASKKSHYYTYITNIVLEHSFAILGHCGADVSINLSAIDIEHRETRETILKLLERYRDKAHRIVFELLEDENVKDFNIMKEFIQTVKRYGVKIAIDDFGSGYSNYERLLDYQPDILKIDGSLIRNIDTSAYTRSVVRSIVTFAKEQNIQTVAEFIENETLYRIVKEMGIDYSQGYHFGKPEPKIS